MLGFFVFILFVGNIMSIIADGGWLGAEDLAQTNALLGIDVKDSGGIPIITPLINFATQFWRVVSWDFSFFPGDLQIIRWFLLVLSAMAIYAIVQEFRSTVTSIFGRR